MLTNGVEIPRSVIVAMNDKISTGDFSFTEVTHVAETELVRLGLNPSLAYRTAEKHMQFLQRAGLIRQISNNWELL